MLLVLGYEGSEVTLFNGWMQSCWWLWYHVGEWLYFASALLAYFSILFWKLQVLVEKEARLNVYCLCVCLPTPENITSGSLVLRTNTLDYYTLTTCNYKGVSYICSHQVPRLIGSRNIFFLEQQHRRAACHFIKKGNLTNVRARTNLPNTPYFH
jgi:hypothetical protein